MYACGLPLDVIDWIMENKVTHESVIKIVMFLLRIRIHRIIIMLFLRVVNSIRKIFVYYYNIYFITKKS